MKTKIIFLSSLLLWSFLSCEKGNTAPDDEPQPEKCPVIRVTSSIEVPTVWKAGSVYVIDGKDININSTLLIEAGVTIKIRDARINVVTGNITAIGNAQQRIVFTSLADDRYCGDSNGDGKATQPSKGDWKVLSIAGENENTFKYCDFFYAGQNSGGYSNAIKIGSSKSVRFEFDYCRFAHTLFNPKASYHSSSAFYAGEVMEDANVSKYTNNAIYDSGKPIYLNMRYALAQNNVFHNPEKPTETNTHNAIYVNPGSTRKADITWNITEVPYVVDAWIELPTEKILKIGPGVIVKFLGNGTGFACGAIESLQFQSTALFTSYKDDTKGGDSNGDGNASVPQKGDWRGIYNAYGLRQYKQGSNILYAEN